MHTVMSLLPRSQHFYFYQPSKFPCAPFKSALGIPLCGPVSSPSLCLFWILLALLDFSTQGDLSTFSSSLLINVSLLDAAMWFYDFR